jgi:branched-chain amino acid transport system permease protein
VTVLKDQLQNVLPLVFGAQGNFEAIVFGVLLVRRSF